MTAKEYQGKERRKDSFSMDQIEAVVEMTVVKTLTGLGFDMNMPIETQKDIAHLRRWRVMCDVMASRAILVALALGVTALLTASWAGVKASINSGANSPAAIPVIEAPIGHG